MRLNQYSQEQLTLAERQWAEIFDRVVKPPLEQMLEEMLDRINDDDTRMSGLLESIVANEQRLRDIAEHIQRIVPFGAQGILQLSQQQTPRQAEHSSQMPPPLAPSQSPPVSRSIKPMTESPSSVSRASRIPDAPSARSTLRSPMQQHSPGAGALDGDGQNTKQGNDPAPESALAAILRAGV
jgi:hypothetical protein